MEVHHERSSGNLNHEVQRKQRLIRVAAGLEPADLVLKHAHYLNVFSNELKTCDIAVCDGVIAGLGEYAGLQEYDMRGKLVLPGLIDAHVHLESALVCPREFVKAVLPHGTTTVITDPHEVANVMGTDGIDYMLQATEGLPVDVRLMLPSCVPATALDEAGASLDYRAIDPYYAHPRVQGLAEVMDFVGVVGGDSVVVEKLAAAQAHHKKIDGHAPGLTGRALDAYVAAGVYSDHECSDLDDALRKLERGQFIMIREGTAAHNLDALVGLLTPQYADRCMFCCDDKHPSDLLDRGHIDFLLRQAIALGADPILAAKAATHNAARYYQLNNRGAIAPGYLADFAILDDFQHCNVQMVFKGGALWYDHGHLAPIPVPAVAPHLLERAHNTFRVAQMKADDFRDTRQRGVMGLIPGELVTTDNGYASRVDLEQDILKIAVIERHKGTGHIGLGYLQGYGLRGGAVATSISHDSHNLIVAGTNSQDMALAANRVASNRGGIVIVADGQVKAEVVLELAGIMSSEPLERVNTQLELAKAVAFEMGVSRRIDPFMTLSFLALPVIPTLRLTTRGVIDVISQRYI